MIQQHPSTVDLYKEKLISTGIVSAEDVEQKISSMKESYEEDYQNAKSYVPDPAEWLASNWQGAAIGSLVSERPYNQTGVQMEILKLVGRALTYVPADMEVHSDIKQLLQTRKRILETGEGVTMAFAESLAFGALMIKFSPGRQPIACPVAEGDSDGNGGGGAACNINDKNDVSRILNSTSTSVDIIDTESFHSSNSSNSDTAYHAQLNHRTTAVDRESSVVDFKSLSQNVQLQEHPMVHIRLSGQV